jgi:hypothetical protein
METDEGEAVTTRRARIWWLTLAACLGAALTACVGPTHSHVSPAVVDHWKGLPKGFEVPTSQIGSRNQKPWAAWAGAHSIYVMTWGSGSCPLIPTSVDTEDSGRVVIETVAHDFFRGDDACTADLGVTTSVVRLPDEFDTTDGVDVQIDGSTTHLSPRR